MATVAKTKVATAMHNIGTYQFLQKKFDILKLSERWQAVLGEVEANFILTVYGGSGQGKTELCVQAADEFLRIDDVNWIDYEQGHRKSLQDAVKRNMEGKKYDHSMVWTDPTKKLKPGDSVFDHLCTHLRRKSTAKTVIINSIDAVRMTVAQYYQFFNEFNGKKRFIIITHAKGKVPRTAVGELALYYGDIGLHVQKYIAQVTEKNRFGGWADYVIYEKRAREIWPGYFAMKELPPEGAPKKRGPKPGSKRKAKISTSNTQTETKL